MEKFVEREKLSKKARRELDRKTRKGWNGLSPVTRKAVNKKAYSRKRVRKIDSDFRTLFSLIRA